MLETELERTAAELMLPDRMVRRIESLCRINRLKGTSGVEEACLLIAQEFQMLPEVKVQVHHFPADGYITYGTWRPPCPWKVTEAEAVLITPNSKEIPLLTSKETSFGLYSYSGAVRERTHFPIIDQEESVMQAAISQQERIDSAVFVQDDRESVIRSILYTQRFRGILSIPHKQENFTHPILKNARTWHSVPLTLPVKATSIEQKPFGISLSPMQGALIQEVLQEAFLYNKAPELLLKINSQNDPGFFPVLEITIAGEKPVREYVLLTAHICHPAPSADDNASGVAACVEIGRMIADIFRRGGLRETNRGVKLLLVPESVGSIAWLLKQYPIEQPIIACINLDMVGAHPNYSPCSLYLTQPPLTMHPFLTWIMAYYLDRVTGLDAMLRRGIHDDLVEFIWQSTPFAPGSDHHFFAFPDVNIPTISLGCWPDTFYHTDADTPERLSVYQLRRIAWATGSVVLDLLAGDVHSARRIIRHHCRSFLRDIASDSVNSLSLSDFLAASQTAQQIYPELFLDLIEVWRELLEKQPRMQTHEEIGILAKKDTGIAAAIPKRLYRGPLSRRAVFEYSHGTAISNYEKLIDEQNLAILSALAQAEMLINGKNTIGQIRRILADAGISLTENFLFSTLNQLAEYGLIEFA